MRGLQEFESASEVQLFQQARRLPVFFENNLVDPARVVKAFYNDPQANIRVFYYQYLKLCFELETVDFEVYIQKIEEIINNQGFKFMFYEDDDAEIFNDLQFKHLIMEFFGVLGQGGVSIEDALNHYPIMDTVFIYFFRAILILTGKTEGLDSYIERDELLQFLGSYFGVQISVHDRCIKFVQTDIFVYEEDPKEVFMAYMDYDNYQDPSNHISHAEIEQPLPQPQPEVQIPQHQQPMQTNYHGYQPAGYVYQNQAPPSNSSQSPPNSHKGNSQINQSYISNEFVDYTDTSKNTLTSMVKENNLKNSANLEASSQNLIKITEDRVKEPTPAESFSQIRAVTPTSSYKSQEIYKPAEAVYKSSNDYQPSYLAQSQQVNQTPLASSYTTVPLNDKIPSFSSISSNLKTSNPVEYSKTEQWQPTKDLGFAQSNYAMNNQFEYKTSTQNGLYDATPFKYEMKKPATSYAVEEPKYSETKKPGSYESYKQQPSKPPSQYQSPQYTPPAATPQNSSKNPYALNVSIEFTNSLTMKSMAEPFRSNVHAIRNRARNYRNSLLNILK